MGECKVDRVVLTLVIQRHYVINIDCIFMYYQINGLLADKTIALLSNV